MNFVFFGPAQQTLNFFALLFATANPALKKVYRMMRDVQPR